MAWRPYCPIQRCVGPTLGNEPARDNAAAQHSARRGASRACDGCWLGGRVAPFRGADRDEILRHRIDATLSGAKDLAACAAGISAKPRDLPGVADVKTYADHRVGGQLDYYSTNAVKSNCLGDRYRLAVTVLSAVATLLGLAASYTPWPQLAAWAPVVATVIAAVTAYGAANRYDGLAAEYACTHQQLELLRLRQPTGREAQCRRQRTYSSPRAKRSFALRTRHGWPVQ